MPVVLDVTKFGNPILRQTARKLSLEEIGSEEIQTLIDSMAYTLKEKSYGVGIAAPQVGMGVALCIVGIKPTPTRPNLEPFETVLINPELQGIGEREEMWEGCISSGEGSSTLFAKVPRYKNVRAKWLDREGMMHNKMLSGFTSHVVQHEVDHLEGALFIDRVKDTKTYMVASEYRRMMGLTS